MLSRYHALPIQDTTLAYDAHSYKAERDGRRASRRQTLPHLPTPTLSGKHERVANVD